MKEAIGGHQWKPQTVRPSWEMAPDMVILGRWRQIWSYGHHTVIRCNQGSSPYGVARFLRFLGLYLMTQAIRPGVSRLMTQAIRSGVSRLMTLALSEALSASPFSAPRCHERND